jgi:hypothetical protein
MSVHRLWFLRGILRCVCNITCAHEACACVHENVIPGSDDAEAARCGARAVSFSSCLPSPRLALAHVCLPSSRLAARTRDAFMRAGAATFLLVVIHSWQACMSFAFQHARVAGAHVIAPRKQPSGLTMVAEPLALYDSMLHEFPLLTKCLTSAVLFGVSDVIAQATEGPAGGSTEASQEGGLTGISLPRVGRFMATGIGSGICWHHWFGFEQMVTDAVTAEIQNPQGLVLARTVLGISLEQFVMIPFYFSLYLIPVVSIQNGIPLKDVPNEISAKLPSLFVNNAKVWTPANAIIYNLPEEFRCLGSNTVDVLWGVLCSTMINRDACIETSDDECLLEEEPEQLLIGNAAAAIEAYIVQEPPILRGRGLPRLVRRRVKRGMVGMGHAVWARPGDGGSSQPARIGSEQVILNARQPTS